MLARHCQTHEVVGLRVIPTAAASYLGLTIFNHLLFPII